MEPSPRKKKSGFITPRAKKRSTDGDYKLASIVTIHQTHDVMDEANKVLGDVSNLLLDPSASTSKKKMAASSIAKVKDSMTVCTSKLREAKKRLSPFASTSVGYALKRLKTGSKNSFAVEAASTPIQNVEAFSTGTATNAALGLTLVPVQPRRSMRSLPVKEKETMPEPINRRQCSQLEFLCHILPRPKGNTKSAVMRRGQFIKESVQKQCIPLGISGAHNLMP